MQLWERIPKTVLEQRRIQEGCKISRIAACDDEALLIGQKVISIKHERHILRHIRVDDFRLRKILRMNDLITEDFLKPKIVWARLMRISKSDIDSFPRFAATEAGTFVVDSLCFFSGNNIEDLCLALNSEYAAYYFFQNVAILDNGGMQMRQQFIEEIPIPKAIISGVDIMTAFDFTDSEKNWITEYIKSRKAEILESY